jgi:hypothetical protein
VHSDRTERVVLAQQQGGFAGQFEGAHQVPATAQRRCSTRSRRGGAVARSIPVDAGANSCGGKKCVSFRSGPFMEQRIKLERTKYSRINPFYIKRADV